jgi:hypothetical protein
MRRMIMIIAYLVLAVCSTAILILVAIDDAAKIPTMNAHWFGYSIGGYGYLCLLINIKLFKTYLQAGRERDIIKEMEDAGIYADDEPDYNYEDE